MTLVFLLEEESMKELLDGLMPRFFPGTKYLAIPHSGKSDLEKSIPRKLRAWTDPDVRFVVVRDQDSADCLKVKAKLRELCREGGKPDSLIRIPCRELEAWFLGDLQAVEQALQTTGLAKLQGKTKFREPDRLGAPAAELKKLVPNYQKVGGARAVGRRLREQGNRSHSFNVFVSGLRRLASAS